jgi:hypothetical protein
VSRIFRWDLCDKNLIPSACMRYLTLDLPYHRVFAYAGPPSLNILPAHVHVSTFPYLGGDVQPICSYPLKA